MLGFCHRSYLSVSESFILCKLLLLCRQAGCENGISKKSDVLGKVLKSYFRVTVTAVTGAESLFSTPHSAGVGCLLSLLPSLKGQVVELSAATRTHLEELLLEGDLLEVSLDQTFLIHRVLQAASVPPREMLHTLIQVRSTRWTRASVQFTI